MRIPMLAAVFPLALLIAIASLVGILVPSTYARETTSWAAQAVGQDWVDLVLAAPWLVITAVAARRGSRAGVLLLGGGLLYAVYELVIYAFAVHFNQLFLLYCAALGLAVYALAGLLWRLGSEKLTDWFAGVPRRAAGTLLIVVGVGFGLLWLGEIVPALATGTVPASLAEAGVPSNPVHAIDLSIILPAHVMAGVLLLRRRPFGYAAAPILLSFGVLMALSIAGMMVVMHRRGVGANLAVVGAMATLAIASTVLLVLTLRKLHVTDDLQFRC
jgi:hypothetical protein